MDNPAGCGSMTIAMSAAVAASKPKFLIGPVRGLGPDVAAAEAIGEAPCAGATCSAFDIFPSLGASLRRRFLFLGARQPDTPALVATFCAGRLPSLALSIPGDDRPRYRTIAERGWHKQRVDAGAAGDDNMNVLRAIGDADMILVAGLGEPARAPVAQPLDAAFGETRQGNTGAFKDGVLDLFFADAVARHRRGVFRADDEQRTSRKNDVVVAQSQRRADKVFENVLARLAAVSEDILRRRRANHRDGVVGRGKAHVDMEGRPWTVAFRFGDAGAEFARLAVGRHVGLAGNVAADIAQHEL